MRRAVPPYIRTFTTAAASGVLFGYDIGATSAVLRILGNVASAAASSSSSSLLSIGPLNSSQLGLIASGSLFGALAASALLFFNPFGDRVLSRRAELTLSAAFFALGTVLQSSTSVARSFASLMFGRFVYGLGIGIGVHVAPLYISETAPSSVRGTLVALKEAANMAGVLLGYTAGAVFAGGGNAEAWRSVFMAALPLEIVFLMATFFVPESPRWLAAQGRRDEAVMALRQCTQSGASDAATQVDEMMALVQRQERQSEEQRGGAAESASSSSSSPSLLAMLSSPAPRKALVVGLSLVTLQQLSGQPSVLYYANRIFEDAGFGFEAAVGLGVFKLAVTLASASALERYGRRGLLFAGIGAMVAGLVPLIALFSVPGAGGGGSLAYSVGIVAAIVVYVTGYQAGFGPMTWTVLSEVSPLRFRTLSLSVATLANFGVNLLVTAAFESERQSIGTAGVFAQFLAVCIGSLAFVQWYVPETKGMSLEQIETALGGGRAGRSDDRV